MDDKFWMLIMLHLINATMVILQQQLKDVLAHIFVLNANNLALAPSFEF